MRPAPKSATIGLSMRLHRRTLLRGAGGLAVALPFLTAMERDARALPFPKRFVVFFTGLGTIKDHWVPTGTETSFTLGPILAPLAPFQDRLVVLEGVDMESAHHGPGDPHQQGIGHALTGTELQEGNLFPYACDPSASVGWGGGMSLDQVLGEASGYETKFKSLEFGVQVQLANVSSRISYRGPGKPVPPDDDPRSAYERLFLTLASSPEELAAKRLRRERVLDSVLEDYHSLAPRLASGDRYKVEAHLETLQDIQNTLYAPGALGGNCSVPLIEDFGDLYDNDAYPLIGKLQMDMLAMALACDLTRVASLQWTTVQTGKVFTWLGQVLPHHTLSHSAPNDLGKKKQLIDIETWHAEQLAYLLGRLDSFPEGDGTVLDNTLVLWCTDISVGNTHSRRDMPYVLAGGAGGALPTGRYVQAPGAWHNDLLVSIAHAMDLDVETFGNPAYCKGPLAALGVTGPGPNAKPAPASAAPAVEVVANARRRG